MTLEEKAAQMMCVWQQKAQTLVDADGNFDEKKPKKRSATDADSARWAAPAMPAKARTRAQHGGADQRHPEVLPREQPPGNSGDVSRGVPARPRGAPDGTSFPQPIALGATFNPELVERSSP
jgi:beta-glucosidase